MRRRLLLLAAVLSIISATAGPALAVGAQTAAPVAGQEAGGGWQSGSRSDMAAEAAAVAGAGMVAVNIDYPLDTVNGHGFPSELTAAEAAVAWVRAHASLLRVDPSRIGALGASAGGNLSLELGAADAVSAVV